MKTALIVFVCFIVIVLSYQTYQNYQGRKSLSNQRLSEQYEEYNEQERQQLQEQSENYRDFRLYASGETVGVWNPVTYSFNSNQEQNKFYLSHGEIYDILTFEISIIDKNKIDFKKLTQDIFDKKNKLINNILKQKYYKEDFDELLYAYREVLPILKSKVNIKRIEEGEWAWRVGELIYSLQNIQHYIVDKNLASLPFDKLDEKTKAHLRNCYIDSDTVMSSLKSMDKSLIEFYEMAYIDLRKMVKIK